MQLTQKEEAFFWWCVELLAKTRADWACGKSVRLQQTRNRGEYSLQPGTLKSNFGPFWTLQGGEEKQPILAHGPGLAWAAASEGCSEGSQYLQRALIPGARAELASAALPSPLINNSSRRRRLLDHDASRASENWILLKERTSLAAASVASTVAIARVWSALGFYGRSIKLLETACGLDAGRDLSWSAKLTRLATQKQVLDEMNRAEWEREFSSVIEKLEARGQGYTRQEFLAALSGIVYFGQRRDIRLVTRSRRLADRALNELVGRMSSFEASLHVSRFYRAASYEPLLLRDNTRLAAEANCFLRIAENMSPVMGREQVFARENLFAALESASRVDSYLGDNKAALAKMKRQVTTVDPHDAKAWIQLGDLSARAGDTEGAIAQFAHAADLEFPHAPVAWFRLGRIYEKVGDIQLARPSYVLSMMYGTGSPSSMLRLLSLLNRNEDKAATDYLTDVLLGLVRSRRLDWSMGQQ